MHNLYVAFAGLQWWEWTLFGIFIYLLLGVYGILMNFRNNWRYMGDFWVLSLFWWAILYENIKTEVLPGYHKWRIGRMERKLIKAKQRHRNDDAEN